MYLAVVALTMLVLPLLSVAIEHAQQPAVALSLLAGRWFVFWGVGARLGLAGLRQIVQPGFTAREIMGSEEPGALFFVRELGFANLAAAVVALLSLALPAFALPAAVSGAIFYAAAGALHVGSAHRSRNENVAMASDLWMAAVLAAFVAWSFLKG